MNKIQLLTYFGFKSEYTATECKTINELYKVCWWAKKSGYRWSNGQSYDDNYMINFLEERFEGATDGEKIAILPVIGMWAYVRDQSSRDEPYRISLNNFIRACKENHFHSIRV